jgi:tRNA (guanine-N7-)-methyltransferase
MSSSAPSERRRPNLYGRRKGPRLSPRQASLFQTLLPQLALTIHDGAGPHAYFSPPPCGEVETRSVSGGGPVKDVWLEIGFGAGEHLLWQAEHNPKVGIIGAEPYEGGVAKLLSKLDGQPLTNIRIHMGDARDIIAALPDASLGRIFILFPDPWPKTRHHKRRFLQTGMLDRLARVMKPGAELRFASDDAPLVAYTLERLMAHPQFAWTAARAMDWKSRPPDWPPTRYEAKQLHGIPAFLRFRRI